MINKIKYFKLYIAPLFLGFVLVFSTCKKDKRITMLKTNDVNSLTYTTAVANAYIIDFSDDAIHDDYGFCYSINVSPTVSDNKISLGKPTKKGNYSSSISGLNNNTKYYLNSYIKEGAKYIYGTLVSFTTQSPSLPIVTTNPISDITLSSSLGGGNVTIDNGAIVTSRGVCWSTSQNPTIANFITTNGFGIGSFTSSITGLSPSTTYYVRAYATNSIGAAYGSQVSFTSGVTLPTVTTNPISDITLTTSTGGGNVTNDNGANVTLRGVCWSTSQNPTIANFKTINGSETGSFISSITGLSPSTTYYVRAYATNSVGTAYGSQVSFITQNPSLPTLTTNPISNITLTASNGGGNISNDGGANVTSRGVCWSTSQNPTIADFKTTDGSGTGNFTSNITGLSTGTTYYLRAYATNSAGTAYGAQVSFNTLNPSSPTLTTSSISDITLTTSTSGGNISNDGGASVTSRGVCWSTFQNPTIADSKTNDGSGTGNFTSSITGLSTGTTYYVRAYATNSVGTSYGSEVSFAFAVGTSYGGGVVFYIDYTGIHGLIAAPTDQSSGTSWGCQGTIIGGTGTGLGTGQANTTGIVNGCITAGIAARICNDLVLNSYSDWFLPSKTELDLLYQERSVVGGFSTYYYWSSTENNGNIAPGPGTYVWHLYFLNGSSSYTYKQSANIRVRAIRAF